MGLLMLHDDFFGPFAGPAVAIAAAAARRMLDLGLSPDQVLARYAALMRAARAGMRPERPAGPVRLARCPQCGARLHAMRVNVTRCTRVGGGHSHMSWCEHCDFEEYL